MSPRLPPEHHHAVPDTSNHVLLTTPEQQLTNPQAPPPAAVDNPRPDYQHQPQDDDDSIIAIPEILPHECMFPIQIGTELFQMSGASLSSDAPSYFSQYFRCRLDRAKKLGAADLVTALRPLYIDRDPDTFRDIALHLRGYYITPRSGSHFVRLFADAHFYHRESRRGRGKERARE